MGMRPAVSVSFFNGSKMIDFDLDTFDNLTAFGVFALLKHAVDFVQKKPFVGILEDRDLVDPLDAIGAGPAESQSP